MLSRLSGRAPKLCGAMWFVRGPVRVERHALGPRVYVAGRRVHEWHAGAGLGAVAAVAALLGLGMVPVTALGALAVWLIGKDWRDVHPATRDTAAWSVGIHRVPDLGPQRRMLDRVPPLAAATTALVGLINVGSAMTSELPDRLRSVLAFAPATEVRLAHALALPVGLALVAAAWPLAKRRRRSCRLAVALLALVGVLNLVKGLDVEEAAVSWALAVVLWRARTAFWVGHPRLSVRATAARVAVLAAASFAAGIAAVAGVGHHVAGGLPDDRLLADVLALMTMTGGPAFTAPFGWLAQGLGVLGTVTVAAAAAMLLAPLRPQRLADALDRRRAAALVRRHGTDTLSAFKLRADLARHWSPDGRALVAYRIEAGTLLMAGDPVGPRDAIPALLADLQRHARTYGLRIGAVGASEQFAAQARAIGLRRLYLGDEALLDTGAMDLAGRAHKSLRKAVGRLRRHGYTAVLQRVDELDVGRLEQMEALSTRWRNGAAERGFSMAHDALVDEMLPDALVVLAVDADGVLRGFLHFVPVFGRRVVSLGFMRRDRDSPNGLNDFLVVEAARLLGERGIAEFSLNFAMCGRWLREPANILERALARVLRVADRWFQIERLLRFTAKFSPRWQPRYLLFDGFAQVPRVALASLWAEGQLPRPSWRRRADGVEPAGAATA
jgi:lysyl-tRNA synthetase, class II